MVPSAYLRVFQPLDGFERSEQVHWERWLVTGRRLRAGQAYRYQQGYEKGWAAGSAVESRDTAEVRPHLGTVPDEGDPPATQPTA